MEKEFINLKDQILEKVTKISTDKDLNEYWLDVFGKNGMFNYVLKRLKDLPQEEKPSIGQLVNKIKNEIEAAFQKQKQKISILQLEKSIDVTSPGIPPKVGHLHIVTQAIDEITKIFERIGFTRVSYPEIEWEWYAFDSLNMPINHPARDDFETFFIENSVSPKFGRTVLSPHTSSGQVREMERMNHKPPVRMINIAKCYRPNWDVNHTPMFYQFEGLVIDRGINITHLKGTMDYFAQEFFGQDRETRLRPFHFQFTEPSFEVDINCGICLGSGKFKDGSKCRYCKEGWLELGGSGMVHPNVLKAGKIDPTKFTGFAFGWGVERAYMMKSGTKLDDNRLLYTNDIRFLEQF